MTPEQKNMELMQTLDDAWNAQDWDTFDKRHKPRRRCALAGAAVHARQA